MRRLLLLPALFAAARAQCPPSVRDPCTCFTTIYEPISIVCDGAASLAQALTSMGPVAATVDSLVLANTPIPRLTAFAFQGYSIRRLVLRSNGLQSIDPSAFEGQIGSTLNELEIRGNKLGQIPVTGLTSLRSLNTLILAKNEIKAIGPSTFQGYASRLSLRKLDLSSNHIVNIDPDAFVGLSGLQEIGMDKNFLTSIPSAALQKIPSLEGLSLGVNKLTAVPVGALLFPKLKSLSLEVNRITNISAEAFQGIPNLLYLYLSDNRFSGLDGSMFRYIRRLKVLAVGNNALVDVSGLTFTYVPGLVRVEMSECGIRAIAPGTFQTLPQLQVLVLNKNRLKMVPRNMFQGLGDLVSLDLKSNEIAIVEDRAFSSLPSLKHLDVSSNRIQTIYPSTFLGTLKGTSPPTTRVLYIYENPWNCDNRLVWLRDWLRQNPDIMIDAPGYTHTLCAEPWWKRRLAFKSADPPTPANATDTTNIYGTTTDSPVREPQKDTPATATAGTLGGANLAAVILGIILGVLILSVLLLMVVRYFIGKNRRDRKEEERWMRDGASTLSGQYASPSPPLDSMRSRESVGPHNPPGQGYFLNRPWYWWF